jgi:enediyne biosynthesis protein E4
MRILSPCLFLIVLVTACKNEARLFEPVPADISGLLFNNTIAEDENLNMINYQYLYNGGGVGIGDFNNDSLPDIYFTSTLGSNKLYLNKGNFRFEDVTEVAKVTGEKKWCRGVAVVDINNDGLLDMYVCAAAWHSAELRKNLLYVNQGLREGTQIPVFKEMAEAYGLDDTSSTHMATFFDYDNDGDLDVYLLVNDLNQDYPNTFRPIKMDGSSSTTDRLYRNDWNPAFNRPVFTNVSKEAGITWEGYGLGINITDINQDGWKDIYISNDYLSGNLLYINNKNGTFSNRYQEYFKQSSLNAMGNDVADINNDGRVDVVEMDMAPEDNYRTKKMMNPIDDNWYQYSEKYGFPYQSVRNTLQLNQGLRVLQNDTIGAPLFSEIGRYSGIARTDWSWSVLLMDADLDGFKDMMTTNGLPKDVTDLDFIAYREQNDSATVSDLMQQLPPVFISNYIYRNNGDLRFTDMTKGWGWDFPTYSAGMAYADFDRDGDMDVVINNTNMAATLLKNNSRELAPKRNYLSLRFRGDTSNINGTGTAVQLHYGGGKVQVGELTPYRGYMSSVEPVLHFGTDAVDKIDSLIVFWPNGKKEKLTDVPCNQIILVVQSAGAIRSPTTGSLLAAGNWFTNISSAVGINYEHQEEIFADFNGQRQLPHKLSAYGPALAAGDLNGDGLADLVVGGSAPYPAVVLIQQKNNRWLTLPLGPGPYEQLADDAGIGLLDVDSDGDLDIYLAAGGYSAATSNEAYADRLYINDSKAGFIQLKKGVPPILSSKGCVKAADFDSDGDLDLFMGGRVVPNAYPLPADGYLLRNESKKGMIKFTSVAEEVAPQLKQLGLITDAVWSDVDNDGDPDLIITREWGSITVFKNEEGKLNLVKTALDKEPGWWNSIASADLDNDGDMDYVAGNFGTNGYYQASAGEPAEIFAKDYDNNNRLDFIVSTWRPASMHGPKQSYPIPHRDQLAEELPLIKKQFPDYTSYASADMPKVLASFNRENELQRTATNFHTGWIENKGDFELVFHLLPAQAQWSPVYGIVVNDFNADGNPDILLTGNEFNMQPVLGRSDALNGLVLQGDGKGNFLPLSILQSGFFVPGNGKALVQIPFNSSIAVVATQNGGGMKLFLSNQAIKIVPLQPNETTATIWLKNGQKRKEEFCGGSSFQSQSARFVAINPTIRSVEFFQGRKQTRVVHQ